MSETSERRMNWGPVDAALFQPTMETIRYELQRFGAGAYFSPEVLREIRADRAAAMAGEGLALKIMGIVATWREERLLKVPANWWEHFKQRWYPRWALKRWPVLYVWYDAAVILPKVPVVRSDYHTVEFAVWQKRGEGAPKPGTPHDSENEPPTNAAGEGVDGER